MNPWTHADWRRLTAYLADDLTPADRAAVETWIDEDPARRDALSRLQLAWQLTGHPRPQAWDLDTMLAQVDSARAHNNVVPVASVPTSVPLRQRNGRSPSSAPFRRWRSAIGASVVALAVAVGLTFRHHVATTSQPGGVVSGPQYTTRTGERATITLRDGSTVTLAPQSTLTVAADFGARRRTVMLHGEAYFQVARVDGAPFIVSTGSVQARVLGTAFVVRHYPTDRDVRVAVTAGKVAIASTTHRRLSAVLVDGVVARVTDSTAVTTTITDPAPYTGWIHGQLEFVDTPLPDVLSALTRWYGYHFQLVDSTLAEKRVTARLDYNSTADLFQALETLLSVSATLELPPRSARPADTVVVLRRRVRASGSAPSRRQPLVPLSMHTEVGR